jgi:hypothetical protein
MVASERGSTAIFDHYEEVHKNGAGKYSAHCAYCARRIKNKSLQRFEAYFLGR